LLRISASYLLLLSPSSSFLSFLLLPIVPAPTFPFSQAEGDLSDVEPPEESWGDGGDVSDGDYDLEESIPKSKSFFSRITATLAHVLPFSYSS